MKQQSAADDTEVCKHSLSTMLLVVGHIVMNIVNSLESVSAGSTCSILISLTGCWLATVSRHFNLVYKTEPTEG